MTPPENRGALPVAPGYRLAAATGAVFCALAVGLAAYSAHATQDIARQRLDTAVLFLFLHGLSLAVFALQQQGRLAAASLVLWLAGSVMFCGSLILAVLCGTPTALAPFGGVCFMLGWLLRAVVLWRSRTPVNAAMR